MALIFFLNCKSTCVLEDDPPDHIQVQLMIKNAAQPFHTIHDILRCLSFVQALLKGQNAPVWRIGSRRINLSANNFWPVMEIFLL